MLFAIFRIAMLLKGKGPGGMAPPFLLGVDSDDETKPNPVNSVPIPMSVDSDDGTISILFFRLSFHHIFSKYSFRSFQCFVE